MYGYLCERALSPDENQMRITLRSIAFSNFCSLQPYTAQP